MLAGGFRLPARQDNRIWGSPTPSPLRGATSPPSFGGEVAGKADRRGGRTQMRLS